MRFMSLVVLLAVVVATTADSTYYDVNNAPSLFENFISRFDRQYKDEADRQVHYEAFVNNLHTINRQNVDDPDATYGITQFADFTDDEKKRYGLMRAS
ncbi:cathepsin F-like [Anticarsia gemmatalis]|uniref:cathepsin F-like n=1 Tax=Anticarsia gemmatalis TaxID=129554 RepID=UPI003F772718